MYTHFFTVKPTLCVYTNHMELQMQWFQAIPSFGATNAMVSAHEKIRNSEAACVQPYGHKSFEAAYVQPKDIHQDFQIWNQKLEFHNPAVRGPGAGISFVHGMCLYLLIKTYTGCCCFSSRRSSCWSCRCSGSSSCTTQTSQVLASA